MLDLRWYDGSGLWDPDVVLKKFVLNEFLLFFSKNLTARSPDDGKSKSIFSKKVVRRNGVISCQHVKILKTRGKNSIS